MKNKSSSLQSIVGEDSENAEAPISLILLISSIAGFFIRFYDRNNSVVKYNKNMKSKKNLLLSYNHQSCLLYLYLHVAAHQERERNEEEG